MSQEKNELGGEFVVDTEDSKLSYSPTKDGLSLSTVTVSATVNRSERKSEAVVLAVPLTLKEMNSNGLYGGLDYRFTMIPDVFSNEMTPEKLMMRAIEKVRAVLKAHIQHLDAVYQELQQKTHRRW